MSDTVDMRLEVVVIPVADVDRAKAFYEGLGWRFDIDLAVDENTRVVQFTPQGSACSIHIGTGITPAAPGSTKNTYLIVEDIEAARAALNARGAEVSEPFHRENGEVVQGRDPNGTSYGTYASFSDPDGNTWMLQEITERLPGR
jgi:predicted enzyme related to lactoylglutathione lyase